MRRSIVLLATTGLLALSLLVVSVGFSPATQAVSWVDSMVSMNHHGSQHMNHGDDCPFGDHEMHGHHEDSSMHHGMMRGRGHHMHQMMGGDRDCPVTNIDSNE